MNYYNRHIGDYLRDTSHLTLLEHGVYARLMDVYYATEKGIPEDQAIRLVQARTDDERSAVRSVLAEFFTLADGEYSNCRCEAELVKFAESQQTAESRKQAEADRKARFNARRSETAAALAALGIVLPWNATLVELENHLERARNVPGTHPERSSDVLGTSETRPSGDTSDAPGTHLARLPNNQSQTPITNNQEPYNIKGTFSEIETVVMTRPAILARCLAALNGVQGVQYRSATKLATRLKNAKSLDALATVEEEAVLIAQHKAATWGGTDQAEHLTPDTLWGPTRWDQYIAKARHWEENGSNTNAVRSMADDALAILERQS